MVKHSLLPMRSFFTRERFGGPQFLAGLLLLVFLAQCLWLTQAYLSGATEVEPREELRIREGLRQWHGQGIAGAPWADDAQAGPAPGGIPGSAAYDAYHSPLPCLLSSAPLLLWPGQHDSSSQRYWGWLTRAPFLLLGMLLGASLWYVSRRLYGNPGGYIALLLYCFAPVMIRTSAVVHSEPEMGAAWGAFGAIFTAIAVAHTLYAPREVVLWNWRRIVLLGLALALAGGSQFSLIVVIPLAAGFLLYLAPERRGAALAILGAGCGIAMLLLAAAYFFEPAALWQGVRHAKFIAFTWKAFAVGGAYRQLLAQLGQGSPGLTLLLPVALVTYLVWRRTRYFGNTAPLLVAVIFFALGLGTPHHPGLGFRLVAMPFLFVFVAGVFADLLETKHRALVQAGLLGLFSAYAIWGLVALARFARG